MRAHTGLRWIWCRLQGRKTKMPLSSRHPRPVPLPVRAGACRAPCPSVVVACGLITDQALFLHVPGNARRFAPHYLSACSVVPMPTGSSTRSVPSGAVPGLSHCLTGGGVGRRGWGGVVTE